MIIASNLNYHSNFEKVAVKASAFHTQLKTAQEDFEGNLTQQGLEQFSKKCTTAITDARGEFSKHRDVWHQLHPIIKGIIGVLATITIIPAVLVAISKQGYVNTFFKTPKTDSAKALGQFEDDLENIFPKN